MIFSISMEEHVSHVYEILSRLGAACISLKLSKWYLFKYLVEYLGHDFLPGKLADSDEYSEVVRRATFPKDKNKLKYLLGMWNVYRWLV